MQINTMKTHKRMKDEGKGTAAHQKCHILQNDHDAAEFQMTVAAYLRFKHETSI